MEFEWDQNKDEINQKKHGVTFNEASTVFGDSLALTFHDPEHSEDEERLLTFGVSIFNKLLIVSHTERDHKMRIISAREMEKSERKIYEEG